MYAYKNDNKIIKIIKMIKMTGNMQSERIMPVKM